MRRKSLILSALVIVTCVASFVLIPTEKESVYSTLQLSNIDALVNGEVIGDKIPCHSSATRKNGKAYVDCASCTRIEGWQGTGTESTCTR